MTLSKGMCLAVALACMAGACAHARTETEGERTEQEFRYDFKVINGKLVKVDRKTGQVQVMDTSTSTVSEKSGVKEVDLADQGGSERPVVKRNRKPIIDTINGEAVENDDREEGSRNVAEYAGQMGISQALQVDGDRISGYVRVTNNGKRQLSEVELTLFVPLASNKTVEHKVVMKDAKGFENVPPPERTGSALNKVEFNAPEIVKGQLEIKITSLKFAD